VGLAVRASASRRYRCANFALQQRAKPKNLERPRAAGAPSIFSGDRFSAKYFETDFASFLAGAMGFPDKGVSTDWQWGRSAPATGLRARRDGQHTAMPGHLFSGGTPTSRYQGGCGRYSGSIMREAEERPADAGRLPRPMRTGIASIRGIDCHDQDIAGRDSADTLRARIEANLAAQSSPELSAIHLVRGEATSRTRCRVVCGLSGSAVFGEPELQELPSALICSGFGRSAMRLNRQPPM